MESNRLERRYDLTFTLAIYIYVLIIFFPNSPPFNVPYADSACFLYHGQQIIDGKLPYVDLFDNKPPLIFYLNALGLLLSNGSTWGVWLLEYVFIVLTSIIGYKMAKRYIGRGPAMLATYFWLNSFIFLHENGNFPEVYALLFQYLAIFLFWDGQDSKPYSLNSFLLGVTLALTLLLKQNLIGIHAAVFLTIAITRLKHKKIFNLFIEWILAALGIIFVLAIPVLYFLYHNALFNFWDIAFQYNFEYIKKPLYNDIRSAYNGLKYLTETGISTVSLIAWFFLVFHLFRLEKISSERSKINLMHLAILLFPISVLSIAISGRSYLHYYITLLPSLFVLSGLFFYYIFNIWSRIPIQSKSKSLHRTIALLLSFIFATSFVSIGTFEYWFNRYSARRHLSEKIISLINDSSSNSSLLYAWGVGAEYNFLTGRKSPTKYFDPFYQIAHASPKRLSIIFPEILNDIKTKKPQLIIDLHQDWPIIPPIDPDKRAQWIIQTGVNMEKYLPGCNELLDYIYHRYERIDKHIEGYDFYILPSK